MKKLILASQSPRRAEILKTAGYEFTILPVYVSETPNTKLSLDEQILDIAERKAAAAPQVLRDQGLYNKNSIILTADTMVCHNNSALGKPQNAAEAAEFLRRLSGNSHEVKTAVYLLDLGTEEKLSHIETTQVFFKTLTESEIQDYISTGEPLDKAGAYAIQGGGRKFVEKFSGDYDNVVGLPLHAVENLFRLKKWNVQKTPQGL